MKTSRKPVAARRSTRRVARTAPLSLTLRIERLEKAVLFRASRKAAAAATLGATFTNLGADGMPTDGGHVAVLQSATGLIWTAAPLQSGKHMTHEAATQTAAALDLLGHKDWRLPTIQELLSIIDYERWDPAVDTAHFAGPYGWTWTSTLVKGTKAPAGYARFVALYGGASGWLRQDSLNQALAVRASQQLGLLG